MSEIHHDVILRVYDLSKGQAKLYSKMLLGIELEGVWHTSIEIYGLEYYFQSGILSFPAGETHHGQPSKKIILGQTQVSLDIFDDFLISLNDKFNDTSYDLFKNNCNHFSNVVSEFLVGSGIPKDILNLPEVVSKSVLFNTIFNYKKEL
ncbi:hypothetical protein GVAV_001746 [Gurleya vavrai]